MKKIKNEKRIWCLYTIIIPLIVGGILYYLLCPEVIFVKIIEQYMNLNIHIQYSENKNTLSMLFRNYFFDYIWAYTFFQTLYLINSKGTKAHLINCIISITLGSVLEVFQFMRIVYGTFDIWDIVVEMTGVLSAFIIIKNFWRKQNEQN